MLQLQMSAALRTVRLASGGRVHLLPRSGGSCVAVMMRSLAKLLRTFCDRPR